MRKGAIVLSACAALALLAGPRGAAAYCVTNELRDRAVVVTQEPHPEALRQERRFVRTIAPGQRKCCHPRNLDCNPGGRHDSVVRLAIAIPGTPAYHCGYPAGDEPNVKVTGAGHVRVVARSRARGALPYLVRVRTHDRQDLTGPRGLACPEANPKGTQ